MKLYLFKLIQIALLLLAITATITSCDKAADSAGSQGIIQVNLADATFESEETVGNRAATFAESTIQRNTIELNKDFLMVAEWRPEDPASTTLKDGTRAALDTAALADNIRYRVLVYSQAGAFVTERDYIRGQEANTEALALDGGSTYIFVVVSLNTTTDIPATTPAVATRTLANSRITTTVGINALMYYRQTMTVSGNSINRLDIVLKHRKPLIGVTINSQQTGYNITAAAGRFDPHNNGMTVNLSDGTHTLTGTETGVNVAFNTVGSQIITNTSSSFINSVSNSVTTFTLTSITIGSVTATSLVPFSNLTVTPGVRYNLILNIVPNDQYLTHQGQMAARIGGQVWMRLNAGASSTEPDNLPITLNRHGNYYQFGRSPSVAENNSTSTNSSWSGNINTANNSWNAGTQTVPIRTVNDPCPIGYRVPSIQEYNTLLSNTIKSNTGNWTTSPTNYSSAGVFTSTRNSNVMLIFPTQGVYGYVSNNNIYTSNNSILNRGLAGYYATNYAESGAITRFVVAQNNANTSLYTASGAKVTTLTVKCIATNP